MNKHMPQQKNGEKATIMNQCPICLKDNRLDRHHWYEDNTYMVGHIRLICHYCNATLRTIPGDDNHILPDWDKQIEYVRKYKLYIRFLSIIYIILKKAKSINSIRENNNPNKTLCPKCNSKSTRHQLRREQYYCLDCQNVWSDDKENNKIGHLLSIENKIPIDKKLANKIKLRQMAKKANENKPRCPKCKSAWTYHRYYRQEYYCRTCQYSWPDDTKKEMKLEPNDPQQKT